MIEIFWSHKECLVFHPIKSFRLFFNVLPQIRKPNKSYLDFSNFGKKAKNNLCQQPKRKFGMITWLPVSLPFFWWRFFSFCPLGPLGPFGPLPPFSPNLAQMCLLIFFPKMQLKPCVEQNWLMVVKTKLKTLQYLEDYHTHTIKGRSLSNFS